MATHADEWNATSSDPADWSRLNDVLNNHCDAIGRDPATIRRGVQILLNPAQENQMQSTPDMLPAFEAAGCQHAMLNFYQPPTEDQLKRVAGLLVAYDALLGCESATGAATRRNQWREQEQ
jgi:hypothetical protein